jgi:hypothetical protein
MDDADLLPIGLSEVERTFIDEHLLDDVPTLLLQGNRYPEIDTRKMAVQIVSRQKARYKLPAWYQNRGLLFPPPLSVEQGSSEATARFKATLLNGTKLIDITGGMGVDCYYMSESFPEVIYYECQPAVASSATYNFNQLGVANRIEVRQLDAIEALAKVPEPADWIYADPARRDDLQRKIAQLTDCSPDIVAALPILFRSAQNILIKTAPLLDIDLAILQLGLVKEVYITGLENECKEVLYIVSQSAHKSPEIPIKVRILHPDGSAKYKFDFTRSEESTAIVYFEKPLTYLYEPHAAILKSGAFKCIATRYRLAKLSPNAHLYTSNEWLPDFPGRGFEVVAVCKPDAREVARYTPEGKANLTTRNFPLKTDDLRKKLRLKEGGDNYLFATELQNKRRIVIVAKKKYLN